MGILPSLPIPLMCGLLLQCKTFYIIINSPFQVQVAFFKHFFAVLDRRINVFRIDCFDSQPLYKDLNELCGCDLEQGFN